MNTRWPLNSRLCASELRYRRAGKGERIREGRAYVRDVATQLRAELDGKGRERSFRVETSALFAGAGAAT